MLKKTLANLAVNLPANTVSAHCDGPCGVYDPASARVAAEAVLSMTNGVLLFERCPGIIPMQSLLREAICHNTQQDRLC